MPLHFDIYDVHRSKSIVFKKLYGYAKEKLVSSSLCCMFLVALGADGVGPIYPSETLTHH